MIIDYSSSHHYYIRDYQGCSAPCDASRLKNNRVAVAHNDTVEQQNDYYAYGGPWGDSSTNQGFQPFKYNGKELDRVHGLDWYDYGARRYDPAFAQFTQMDPLCEKYPHLSPYAYCAGNPVRYVDPEAVHRASYVGAVLLLGETFLRRNLHGCKGTTIFSDSQASGGTTMRIFRQREKIFAFFSNKTEAMRQNTTFLA